VSCMEGAYAAVSTAVRPFLPGYLQRRLERGKEIAARLPERFGEATRERPPGRLVWLHGASVGETLSSLPLLNRLLELNPDLHILVTSGTVTSASLMEKRLPPRAFHQFVPLDAPAYVLRFLQYWKPDAVLWLESELWPGLLAGVRRRNIPAALVNARLSAKSARNWRWASGWIRLMLSTFTVVLAQSKGDAVRLQGLDAPNVQLAGNLKFTAPALAGSADSLAALLAVVGDRPRWIMASTHEGEEAIAVAVHRKLMQNWPELLTIIVPRHPERAESIVAELGNVPLTRRSTGALPGRGTGIYLADTLGELGTIYSAAPIACVGGSFSGKGGHNPIEPAQCGCAVLAGPDMGNFLDVAAELTEAGALVQVADGEALAREVEALLANSSELTKRQRAGLQATQQQERILASVLSGLAPVLSSAGLRTT